MGGAWSSAATKMGLEAPLFVSITGASIGWQIGIQGTDLILVFNSKSGLESLMHDKLTLGANICRCGRPRRP